MKLNTISPAEGSKKDRRRVGRGIGSGFGKTAGRGHKGQHARSGGYHKVGFEGGQMPLQRRIPKRGFRNTLGVRVVEVALSQLESAAIDGVVDLEGLLLRRIVRGSPDAVKVILTGEITQGLTVRGLRVSAGARAAIEQAGGKVED
ncbi:MULTISPECIES: 50S ribosomal protein L15 [Acidithiobacillus]|jgi:large subunit ribosomal protein L15|uniref:Large ribosomal subunit protein uL15 n=2 Tax=Acidithiobacillus ferridurans TaxID=1232575 RepID=A0A2Z6IH17_ACIFI|nr:MULTISPECIES: 50S ribosomal protein L15 [Acidithiobacillus]MBU2715457.1 50S ribosomal protein L15 [Acidithiobacillus ferridurans]MBU2717972.1 50S ribosomal protein L15 [Acidithiobacillus ferridurans]MBU2722307.1 50S ribosomal protein L15 [Acidithiobacillus ferridurans]MBU2727596.1 50S ribosomal protein L15 [Acidithiobacillus ferridurans]MBU2731542.1 50S ribosomal protein L15 [Acidithiobacillus ferridurans]